MNNPNIAPPSLADLTAGFLRRTEGAETLCAAADALGEVQPHEVAVGLRAEPRLAWAESLDVLRHFGLTVEPVTPPAEWGGLVARQDGVYALPMALANYPQRVRNLGKLVEAGDLHKLLPARVENAEVSTALLKWGTRHIQAGKLPEALLASATYRSAGDFARAGDALSKLNVDGPWGDVLRNELAALAWHQGRHADALAQWNELPDSVPVWFNRGMASLFLGDFASARSSLRRAVEGLPEESPWHHLAGLYFTLAEIRCQS